ncbi:efflux RND transporter periplasmic adaptor subunit [Chthonobacter albigriseus]|uniref:efflux RND transporter periplasmic adaptor subunit n=1 Tax=Chthonobacter albigriseus TaxID=1683161 RepID=UPI0015EEB937|nr:efflux RND transporter periplasmic adaptor subunit [Chthonobacter albigriseus]
MIKRFIVALVLLTLVCGGIVGFNMFRAQMIANFFANMPQQTVTVSTMTVEPVRWEPGIDAVGTVFARQGVDVASRSSGVIEEIRFKANDKVEAGAILVRIERRVEEAELIAARANVVRDQQGLDRARALASRGVNSTATLEEAQAQLDSSRSSLERLEAELEQKDIVAPFAGTVGIARVDIGQYITPGTVIATLQDLERMKVNFTVPEQQLPNLSIGQQVAFGLTQDALPYVGQITGIDPKIDPASRLISVQAEVDNSDGKLRPGQFINVRIQLPAEDNIVALPQTAVVTSLYGSYVYVVQEEEPKPQAEAAPAAGGTAQAQAPAEGEAAKPKLVARQVFVEVGRRNANQIEVTKGVTSGAQVVTAGQNRLSSGSPVVVDNTIDPSKIEQQGANVAGGPS